MLTVRQWSDDGGLTWKFYDASGTLQPFAWTSSGGAPGWATVHGLVYVGTADLDPVHGQLHRLRWTSTDGRKVVSVLARVVQEVL